MFPSREMWEITFKGQRMGDIRGRRGHRKDLGMKKDEMKKPHVPGVVQDYELEPRSLKPETRTTGKKKP